MYKPPKYIEASGFIGTPCVSKSLEGIYSDIRNRALNRRISGLTMRAMVGLAISVTEWTLWRLHPAKEYVVPYQYIDAAWATIIDSRYLTSWDAYSKVPNRPTSVGYGGIIEAIGQLSVNIEALGEIIPGPNHIGYTVTLARYVLPNKRAFNKWLNAILDRLEKFYPLVDFNYDYEGKEWKKRWPKWFGAPIPREAFDPKFDFHPDMTDKLISSFLESLNPDENPFLVKPKNMLKNGFRGTPYSWTTSRK